MKILTQFRLLWHPMGACFSLNMANAQVSDGYYRHGANLFRTLNAKLMTDDEIILYPNTKKLIIYFGFNGNWFLDVYFNCSNIVNAIHR
jgi:hypothetical protein